VHREIESNPPFADRKASCYTREQLEDEAVDRAQRADMLFLIEYDRPRGSIVQLREFDAASRQLADETRLNLELDLKRQGIEHEVVLLDAPSKEALRHTHSRYFEDVVELARGSPQVQALLMETATTPRESET
jgi:hypothetical protein